MTRRKFESHDSRQTYSVQGRKDMNSFAHLGIGLGTRDNMLYNFLLYIIENNRSTKAPVHHVLMSYGNEG